jgi:hypothetical protein
MNCSTQYFVFPPTRYLQSHQERLLPDWHQSVAAVLLVLQKFPGDLEQPTQVINAEKDRLRQHFFAVGQRIAQELTRQAYQVEIFDPRTGLPTLSTPGVRKLDDVAIAHTLLGYPVTNQGGCAILIHPQWHNRVYPATILASAPPERVQQVVDLVSV